MGRERKIIHVDMDQFYVAVEQRDTPELRGKPVAVGHDAERGVVSTASYEARRYGVHSAQSIQVAKRLCPQLIIVEPHFQKYKEASGQIRDIFHDYTDLIEPISLDEAFLDVTVPQYANEKTKYIKYTLIKFGINATIFATDHYNSEVRGDQIYEEL